MKNAMRLLLIVASLLPALAIAQAPASSGAEVYARYCAACHEQADARIVPRAALEQMSAARILRALDFGAMMSVAYPIRREDRLAVAAYLGKGADDPPPPKSAFCGPERPILAKTDGGRWPGWSPDESNTRFQSAAGARLRAEDLGRLELKWAFGFANDVIAFAAPTVVAGTLFVGSAAGTVQALDAATGCIHWQYDAQGPVRAAPTLAGDGATLVFSDQNGGVHAIDARTGKERWRVRVEPHEATRLTSSAAVLDDLVFIGAASWEETRSLNDAYPCCTFRGSVTALRIADGSVAWRTFLIDPPRETGKTATGTATFGPSGAGVWSTPTVDRRRQRLYITTGDNYSHPATATSDAVIALDLADGHIVWTQQVMPNDVYNSACGSRGPNCPENSGPDYDFGSSAMLIRTASGREILAAGQKSGVVYAFDPDDNGRMLWQTRVGKGSTNGGVQWGMASDGRNVYAAVSDVVRPPGLLQQPGTVGNAALDGAAGGGLTALALGDGSRVWFAAPQPCSPPRPGCSPAQPGAVTAIEGAVLSGSLDGHLRAFATTDGRVLWDVDTAKPYETVNGVSARGGSLDGAGPVVVDGFVLVNSGYPRFGGMPGNVLLAFGLPD